MMTNPNSTPDAPPTYHCQACGATGITEPASHESRWHSGAQTCWTEAEEAKGPRRQRSVVRPDGSILRADGWVCDPFGHDKDAGRDLSRGAQ